MTTITAVSTLDELVAVAGDPTIPEIRVRGPITGAPAIHLAPGQRLLGVTPTAAIAFAGGVDGVRLSADNEVAGLRLRVAAGRRAIHNDTGVADLGTLRLTAVTTVGQVELLARDRVRTGHIEVDQLDIVTADLRDRPDRPALLGVGVLPGAFTLWNQQPDAGVVLTARLRGISAGRTEVPVRGSGVFVSGAGSDAGRVEVSELTTGAVFTDGGIAPGTHDTISGGVFVLYGVRADRVDTFGPVTTYGVNDMLLDNWGEVTRWTAHQPLTSYGPSGVGFVNFGAIGALRVAAPIETHGVGARGFNVYRLDGFTGPTVESVEFDRIVTHADAAIGVQIGQPIGRLTVHRGIQTHGGSGDSLVRGVITRLSAHALSVQAGGRVEVLDVAGGLRGAGAEVSTVDVRGEVVVARVAGGIVATGAGADAVRVDGGTLSLSNAEVTALDGAAVRIAGESTVDLAEVRASGAGGGVVDERPAPADRAEHTA